MSNDLFFAKKSPAGSATTEELDHLLVVVRLPLWLPLGALVCICFSALVWSIWGRIPITVNGVGVLINPGNVKGVQAEAGGQVEEILVRPGDIIKEGDNVAVVRQTIQEQSVRQAHENHDEIKVTNTRTLEVNAQRFKIRMDSLDRQEALLTESKELSESVHTATQERYDAVLELSEEGLANRDLLLSSKSALVESQTKMSNYEVQLQQLELEREQAMQENIQTEFGLRNQIDDARRTLERLELQLENERYVRSGVSGRVLEVKISVGRMVSFGTPVISVETSEAPEALVNLCYFPVKDGKRILDEMRMLITPTTVKRERYGGIVGTVTKVSSFPVSREAAINVVGSQELTSALMTKGAMIEVEAVMKPSENTNSVSNYQWSSKDPPVVVSQGMVTMNRITIEQRAPITYIMPLLRSWFQGQKDDYLPGI